MKIQLLIMCAALALAVGCDQRGRPASESGTDQGTGTRSYDTNQPSTNNPSTNQTSPSTPRQAP